MKTTASKTVAVLYNAPEIDAAIDELDVLTQRDTVVAALRQCGHRVMVIPCTLNLERLRNDLVDSQPEVAFNLVESLGGTDRLMPLVPLLLEGLGIPYTGTSATAIQETSNKLAAKQRLRQAGLPTPEWIAHDDGRSNSELSQAAETWIVKPVFEHASLGMEDDSILDGASTDLVLREIRAREERIGRPHFAERFIAGREFNLSMLVGEVLPPAEIDFSGLPHHKRHIVGYRAKWETDSEEYQLTPRRFDSEPISSVLHRRLVELARNCWELFSLNGYARVDFRVDHHEQPWILEINANPCLSPDAGFAAAVSQSGCTLEDAIEMILNDVASPSLAAPNITRAGHIQSCQRQNIISDASR
jgi:D-alanine-D-alanine ligase